MLPAQSTQAEWVRDHELSLQVSPPQPKNNWAKKLGPLAPIAIFLAKAKWLLAIFKFKFLFSLGAFFALYWAMWGWKFGVGFGVLILIHEMGHYIDIRRRGLPADMPVFLPGFGAYVRWQALGVSLETRAGVSLAGPLAGLLASFACLAIWWETGDPLWAGLTRAGAWLNLMNLIPVWVLDGGQATNALDRNGRWSLLAAAVLCALVFQESVFLFVAAGFYMVAFYQRLAARLHSTYRGLFHLHPGIPQSGLANSPRPRFQPLVPPDANSPQNETLCPFSTLLLCTNNSGGKTLHELSVG